MVSFLKGLFAKKADEDYETVLSNLANDIQNRQVKLSEIRLRERRSTLLVTSYTLAAWVAYVSLWYLQVLPALHRSRDVERALKGLPVLVGPILILFIRRIVQIWYQRKGNAEEKTLQNLMKQRRDKVEEIKKKTNYYTTRDLLQKYDESGPADTPIRRRPVQPVPPSGAPASTPQQPKGQPDPRFQTPAPKKPIDTSLAALTPSYQVGPPRRHWYDKVADALLGDDDQTFNTPSSRYALICEKCFTHNGLVKESMWEDAQYVCPKCNHFNASIRSKRQQHQQGLSPSTPAGISRIPLPSVSPQPIIIQPALPKDDAADPDRDPPTVDNDTSLMDVDHDH